MPLYETDWDLVTCLVRDNLLDTVDPHSRLREIFPPGVVSGLRLTHVSAENARAVVTMVREASLEESDPLALRLLRGLRDDVRIQVLPDRNKIEEYVSRLEAEKALLDNEDPFYATILSGGTEIFINRRTLRPELRRLCENTDKFVLRVSGDRSTGKSHTYRLIQHLAERRRFRPAYVPLSEASTAEDAIRELGLYFSNWRCPRPLDDHDKWIGYAARTLAHRAAESGVSWWFVLDECNKLPAGSDVVKLILALAEGVNNITGDVTHPRPRLILLGYNDNLPTMPYALRNKVCLDEAYRVADGDLRDFFRENFRKIRPVASLDADIEEAVQQILEYVALQAELGRCYMNELNKAVEEALHEYRS